MWFAHNFHGEMWVNKSCIIMESLLWDEYPIYDTTCEWVKSHNDAKWIGREVFGKYAMIKRSITCSVLVFIHIVEKPDCYKSFRMWSSTSNHLCQDYEQEQYMLSFGQGVHLYVNDGMIHRFPISLGMRYYSCTLMPTSHNINIMCS